MTSQPPRRLKTTIDPVAGGGGRAGGGGIDGIWLEVEVQGPLSLYDEDLNLMIQCLYPFIIQSGKTGPYKLPCSLPPSGRSVELPLKKPKTSLPQEQLEFDIIFITDKQIQCTVLVYLCSDLFTKDLYQFQPIPSHNILCFGVYGAGKTSFIKDVFATLNESKKINIENPAGNECKLYKVSEISGVDIPVTLHDSKGLDRDNYGNLEQIITGYAIHCVLVFVPSSLLDSPLITKNLEKNISTLPPNLPKVLIIRMEPFLQRHPEDQNLLKEKLKQRFSLPTFSIDNQTTFKRNISVIQVLSESMEFCSTYQTLLKGETITCQCGFPLRSNYKKCPKCKIPIKTKSILLV